MSSRTLIRNGLTCGLAIVSYLTCFPSQSAVGVDTHVHLLSGPATAPRHHGTTPDPRVSFGVKARRVDASVDVLTATAVPLWNRGQKVTAERSGHYSFGD